MPLAAKLCSQQDIGIVDALLGLAPELHAFWDTVGAEYAAGDGCNMESIIDKIVYEDLPGIFPIEYGDALKRILGIVAAHPGHHHRLRFPCKRSGNKQKNAIGIHLLSGAWISDTEVLQLLKEPSDK